MQSPHEREKGAPLFWYKPCELEGEVSRIPLTLTLSRQGREDRDDSCRSLGREDRDDSCRAMGREDRGQ